MLEEQGSLTHLIFLAGPEGLRMFQISGCILAEAWSRPGIPFACQPKRGVCSLPLRLEVLCVAHGALLWFAFSLSSSPEPTDWSLSLEKLLCVGRWALHSLGPAPLTRGLGTPFGAAKSGIFSMNPALVQNAWCRRSRLGGSGSSKTDCPWAV